MSYFEEHYPDFKYPLQSATNPGFRLAQLGAIHAAASHFVTRSDPGIITMPTGSGKTAVLISTAYILRASRVLIITPSRLVREQIAEEVRTLATLRLAGALGDEIPAPRVFSVKKRITSLTEWESLKEYDVVVGTVQSISPEYATIPEPPPDLFDLVLVDEAHHSPARTWQAVLDNFRLAKRLLFTATPFRQDQREIKGRFIFTYDLKKAFDDGVFGEIAFQAVAPAELENTDIAIAKAAEQQLSSDREHGYQHHLMVRTDTRKRAKELLEIYNDHTSLRLSVVTGDKSLKYVKKVVKKLDDNDLDGILCVNMLGEGFNFPSLKIAAIHSPHRSLAVTLQFIGRFARTGGANLGPATFLAIPSEIEIEAEHLYDTRAVWQEMVQNLSATRVTYEAETREVLASFSLTDLVVQDLADLSLYVLEPYYHVKIYQLDQAIDMADTVVFPDALQVVYKSVSPTHNASVYITREISLPRWTVDDRLSMIQHDLFIFHQDIETKLLFICASRRSAGLYEQLVSSFDGSHPRPLPLFRLNHALNELETPEFFNVGMRNRVASNTTESYRIITGSNADKAIQKSDSRLYHRGHIFGRATEDGNYVTIGLSSASKIWSNKSTKLPALISWCGNLARRIFSEQTPVTGSGLDFLDVGEEINELPPNVIGIRWPHSVYIKPPIVRFVVGDVEMAAQLLDFDLSIDLTGSDNNTILIVLRHDTGFEYRATFSFETNRFFEPYNDTQPDATVERDREQVQLIDFINGEMPHFYTAELGFIDGNTFLKTPEEGVPPLEMQQIEEWNWATENVDINCEYGDATNGRLSIHQSIEQFLRNSDCSIVYYDHGTGEIADFIAITLRNDDLFVQLYHCKCASGPNPGHRVEDIYEVVGQAIKSITWALKQRILSHIRRRFTQNIGGHRFVKGDMDLLDRILAEATPAKIDYEIVAVQPGLKKNGLPQRLAHILSAASDYLARGNLLPLRIISS
ncbi:MAG TPA: DEAD/DEAH box helicase family protein [bacterium]|nr:DEAD/DEAH box helicase family protein [bacterium]